MTSIIHRPSYRQLLTAALGLALVLAPALGATDASQAWSVDPNHTELNFSVRHFFTPVNGSFRDFEVDLSYDAANPEKSTVEARIAVASIDTGNDKRDDHLRSADWFEAEKYPHITFKSTSVRKQGKNKLIAKGPLTIKGNTKEIELPITLLGTQPIPEQMRQMLGGTQEVASFEAGTTLNRGDFGVGVGNWAQTMVVGGEVSLELLVEAHRR